jgi:thioredoxin 1
MGRPNVFSLQSYEDAFVEARHTSKLLIVDATASWCPPCKLMDRTTWVDAAVVAWLEENAVAVQIDVDEEKKAAASLGIRAMPTVVAFRDGMEVDRVVGLKKPDELLAWLASVKRGETSLDQVRRAAQANPKDMRARYALAKTLASRGRFSEATNEYAWLWQHVTEYEPAMVGVRGSYMLHEIERLMQDHPEARSRFAELRDALGSGGVPPTAAPDAIADWIALSGMLGEKDRVIEWFDHHAAALAARPEVGTTLRLRLVPLLIERGRWADIGRLFRDPLAVLRESHERLEDAKRHELPPELADRRPMMIEAMERALRKNAALITISLLAAEREPEARAVLEEARRLIPGNETENLLTQTASQAGVSLP